MKWKKQNELKGLMQEAVQEEEFEQAIEYKKEGKAL